MHTIISHIKHVLETLRHIVRLPVAELRFQSSIAPEHVAETYRRFTKPHPKYLVIQNKTIGAALLDTEEYASSENYLASISKRNHGGYFAKRARSRGYHFREIDRNRYVEDIDRINNSLPYRQGRPMASSYRHRASHYTDGRNFRYYGVLDPLGKLMAYCELGTYGNFALLSRLLGYRNNDGIMHFMIVEIVGILLRERAVRFVMYDTFFGASAGLRNFKTILGFKPYRAKYNLE